MTLPKSYLDQIKRFEGYHASPYWDYKQWTSGYGTRATGPNDAPIDEAEAERRLNAEIANAARLVDEFAPGLDEGTRAALTSLTYNAGGKWMGSGLGQAVRSGDPAAIRERLTQYVKAGGQTLPGLVNRRRTEAGWIGGAPPAQDAAPMPFSLAVMADEPAPMAQPEPQPGGLSLPFGLTLTADRADRGGGVDLPEPPKPRQSLTAQPHRTPIDMTRIAALAAERRKLGV